MVDYFRRWYVPNNMAMVLAGDVDAGDRAARCCDEHFGAWQAAPARAAAARRAAALTRADARRGAGRGRGTGVRGLADGVGRSRRRAAPSTVMDLLMADARAGLINSELVLPQKIPRRAPRSRSSERGGPLAAFTAPPATGQPLDEIERLLLETVAQAQGWPVRRQGSGRRHPERGCAGEARTGEQPARAMRMATASSSHRALGRGRPAVASACAR